MAIYTNGSKCGNTVAAAFCVLLIDTRKHETGRQLLMYKAELSILRTPTISQTKFIILTDSLGIATSIKTNS